MQKTVKIEEDGSGDLETKEELLEWNGEDLFLQFSSGLTHTCGLRNLGNTCYMNSVVQALANVRPLAAFLVSDWAKTTSPGAGLIPRSESAKNRRRFVKDLGDTIRHMWSGRSKDLVARSLINAVIDTVPEFRMHGQQDAEEALTYALNNLHDDLFVPVPTELHPAFATLLKLEKERKRLDQECRSKGSKKVDEDDSVQRRKEEEERISQAYEPHKRSIVSDTFQSLLAQRVVCAKCECTSLTVQECFNLPLELPSKAQTKAIPANGDTRSYSNSKLNGGMKSFSSSSSLDQGSPKVRQVALAADTDAVNGTSAGNSSGGMLSSAWSSFKSVFSGHSLELDHCLRSFFSPETLKGEEQYYCENCKSKEDATKTQELIHLPEVMCLQLKRFNKSRGTWGLGSAKNSTWVKYPVEGLDLAPYCGEACLETENTIYDLIGVVRHSGGANSGHYIATCKSLVQGKWYECDDEFVTPVASLDSLQSTDAYLLFYSKRPSQSDTERRERVIKTLQARTAEPRIFVSKYWALKFETMSRPGPVDNCSFACEHGRVAMPALSDVRDRVISVPLSALGELEKEYGTSVPPCKVMSTEACEQCKETFEALGSRRAAEYEECSELIKQPKDAYYVIPSAWFSKWLAFVHNDCGPLGRGSWMGSSPPPSMDTRILFEKDGTTLKKNLKAKMQYELVNRPLFKFWEKSYGILGPVLVRKEADVYSEKLDDIEPVNSPELRESKNELVRQDGIA